MVKHAPLAHRSPAREPGPSSAPDMPRSEYVLSLERGLSVIRVFNEQHPRMTLAEVAQRSGLTRAAARRFLLTLQSLGYVRSEGRYFQLTPQLLDLGYAYLASQPWWRYAQHVAERFALRVQHACAVTVLDRASIVYVAYASAARFSLFSRSIGARLPAHSTAGGRILLAALSKEDFRSWLTAHPLTRHTRFTITDPAAFRRAIDKVAAERVAVVEQELVVGLRVIAVPIVDRGGRVAAALSVSVQELTAPETDLVARFLEPLREASREITSGLAT